MRGRLLEALARRARRHAADLPPPRAWDAPAEDREATGLFRPLGADFQARVVGLLLGRDAAAGGETLDELIPRVYDELHRLAASYLRREWRDRRLGESSLVHETYLRLAGQKRTVWRDRRQFFGTAALIMRRLVVDHARSQLRAKRRGREVALEEAGLVAVERAPELAGLDQALGRLEKAAPELSEVVQLRFFAGLSHRETAEILGVSAATVARRWSEARAWLQRHLDT